MADIKGTKTEKNLMAAFSGESQARNKYTYFAKIAQKQGYVYAVRNCTISYKSPARYGETLICTASLKKMTAAQLIFDQQITEKTSGRLVVTSEVNLVCLTIDFKPSQIPENLRKILESDLKNT